MEPVRINIATATPEELRAECERLSIPRLKGARIGPDKLRRRLRAYQADCKLYEQWTHLLGMLPGGEDMQAPAEIETLMDTVCDLLFGLLLHEGYVHADETTSSGQPIFDSAHSRNFYILSRQNTRVLDTTVGGYSVIHAAQCAFSDIRAIFVEWEKWKAGNRGSR